MANRNENNELEEEKLYQFLTKTIAFVWAYSFIRPGVNALRTPLYPEMIRLVNHEEVTFDDYKLEMSEVDNGIRNYIFTNGRPITRSMLAWWMYQDENQELLDIKTKLEIEHIYPKKRQEHEKSLSSRNVLERLGNKALLEEKINIRASDYRFEDKVKYYKGFTTDRGVVKQGTKNNELVNLANTHNDYNEEAIQSRTEDMYTSFLAFVQKENLFK